VAAELQFVLNYKYKTRRSHSEKNFYIQETLDVQPSYSSGDRAFGSAPRSLFLLINGRLFYSGNLISIDPCAIGLLTRGHIRWRRTYLKYPFARAIFYFEAIRIEKVICATFTELVFD